MIISNPKKISIVLSLTFSMAYAETTQNPHNEASSKSDDSKYAYSTMKTPSKKTSINLNVTPTCEKGDKSSPVTFSRDENRGQLRDADLSDTQFVKRHGFEKNPFMRTVTADHLYAKRSDGEYFTHNSTRPETRPKKRKK